jgi:outer membrane protein OmpA-like peptidoglycan-associated protein
VFAAIRGGIVLFIMLLLCGLNAVAAIWFDASAPHVEVRSLDATAAGAKLDVEHLEAILAWNESKHLNRPIMNVLGERPWRAVSSGALLTDEDLDEPGPAQLADDAECRIAIPGGEDGPLCLDIPPDGRKNPLPRLLAHLDRLQRDDADGTKSSIFLEHMLDRLADWHGIKLAENMAPRVTSAPTTPPPPAKPAPVSEPPPAPTTLLFGKGAVTLPSSAISDLAPVIALAGRTNDCTIVVIGYSDASGSPDLNLLLSYRRAVAVSNLLLGRGLQVGSVLTLAHGSSATRSGSRANGTDADDRRVEIRTLCGTGRLQVKP